jgi:hypothetical protein
MTTLGKTNWSEHAACQHSPSPYGSRDGRPESLLHWSRRHQQRCAVSPRFLAESEPHRHGRHHITAAAYSPHCTPLHASPPHHLGPAASTQTSAATTLPFTSREASASAAFGCGRLAAMPPGSRVTPGGCGSAALTGQSWPRAYNAAAWR